MPRKLTKEEKLVRKKNAEKKRRDKIKSNPELYQKYLEDEKRRYAQRKDQKQIKSITELTPRQQRVQRRRWKEHSKNYRQKKKHQNALDKILIENSPPTTDNEDEDPVEINRIQDRMAHEPSIRKSITRFQAVQQSTDLELPGPSRQVDSPKSIDACPSVQRRYRYKKAKELIFYKQKTAILQKKIKALQKQLNRLKQTKESPTKKTVENLIKDPERHEDVKKRILFGELIKTTITENYSNATMKSEKKKLKTNIEPIRPLFKKYKLLKKLPTKLTRKTRIKEPKNSIKEKIQNDIREFYENDENSRIGAGKKEFITVRKESKQKRYLQDSLKNLHRAFLDTHQYKISYTNFCQQRPFWVVYPKDKNRDTCMCKLHANVDLLLQALYRNKIIAEKSHQELLGSLVCNIKNVACLE